MRKQLLGSNRIGNNEEAVESVIAPARLFHAVGGPGWLQVHLGKERDISGTGQTVWLFHRDDATQCKPPGDAGLMRSPAQKRAQSDV